MWIVMFFFILIGVVKVFYLLFEVKYFIVRLDIGFICNLLLLIIVVGVGICIFIFCCISVGVWWLNNVNLNVC